MEKENDKEKEHQIKKQIEYYLSDTNLSGDAFFHSKIAESEGGYLDLDLIMSCKKVQKAGWTKEDIIQGISTSTQVEVNPEKTKIRRVNNKPLPSLDLLKKKRKKETEPKSVDPIILTVKAEKDSESTWKEIQDKYKKINPTLTVLYTRFQKDLGYFAVVPTNSNKGNEEDEIDFVKEFDLNDIKFQVSITKGDELEQFYKEYGTHLEMCVNKDKNLKINKKNKTKLSNPVTLGNSLFVDICHIKGRVRKIMSSNPDMNPLDKEDFEFIKDLLEYHQDKDILLDGMESIASGKIDPHSYSKGFFALGQNGKKDLFFVNKCIERLLNENRKKNKKEH